MGRQAALIAALVMIAVLAFVMIDSLARGEGNAGLVVVTVVILAVIGFGVVGALTEKSDE